VVFDVEQFTFIALARREARLPAVLWNVFMVVYVTIELQSGGFDSSWWLERVLQAVEQIIWFVMVDERWRRRDG
jgi:hypothetical protein